jgi:DNA segregation ATPase FtsK/SpoIIIE, S-DNA-T family
MELDFMGKAQAASPVRRMFANAISYRPFKFNAVYEREVFFIASLGLTAFYITALATFSPMDPSPVAASFPVVTPSNLAGNLGASISGMALFILGVAAWLLPLPFLGSSLLILKQAPNAIAKSRLLGWVLAMSSVAAIAAGQFKIYSVSGFELPAGGIIGTYISNLFLVWLGNVGSFIAIGTISLCSLMLIFRRSVIGPISSATKDGISRGVASPLWWDNYLHGRKERALQKTAAKELALEHGQLINLERSQPEVNTRPEPPMIEDDIPLPEAPATSDNTSSMIAPAVGLFGNKAPGFIEKFKPKAKRKAVKTYSDYTPPSSSILNKAEPGTQLSGKELENTASLLIRTFLDFNIKGKIIGYQPGPVVTVFEFQPEAGIKQSKVLGLIDDIALSLKVDSIFIHPVKGKRALGVQVPNIHRETVFLGDIIDSETFLEAESPLTFAMGKTLSGAPLCADLATMPHLLAAGATGSGKSVAINSLLCSIIMKASPDDVKMILVDPKMLELSVYEGIPHLLMPVITEPPKASLALKWSANEMERRYRIMQLAQVRNIMGYNNFWEKSTDEQKQHIRDEMGDDSIGKLPYIMLVIDELADLMMTAPKDVEASIQRLAQKARASGIHMVLATQRPSVDIITGVIKANLPCRVAFQVVSKIDSRTILDIKGAENLLGKGDMLLQKPGTGRLERIQGALVSDEEVINLVAAIKAETKAEYDENVMTWIDDEISRQSENGEDASGPSMEDDEKYDMAVHIAQQNGSISASFLQRKLQIGYNRAARIVEAMEAQGLIGKADGAKPRKWLGPNTEY